MNGFYSWAMRSAAAILFTLAIMIPAVSVIVAFTTYAGPNSAEFSMAAPGGIPSNFWPLIGALINGLSNAILPLFGAALLWRWDRYIQSKATAE